MAKKTYYPGFSRRYRELMTWINLHQSDIITRTAMPSGAATDLTSLQTTLNGLATVFPEYKEPV